jgi:hypothetical protein
VKIAIGFQLSAFSFQLSAIGAFDKAIPEGHSENSNLLSLPFS